MLGLIDDYRLMVRPGFAAGGLSIYLLGSTHRELGGSEFAEAVLGRVSGRPPILDVEVEGRLHQFLYEAARRDLLASAHDCSDGGLAIALAECAIAGGLGFRAALPASTSGPSSSCSPSPRHGPLSRPGPAGRTTWRAWPPSTGCRPRGWG